MGSLLRVCLAVLTVSSCYGQSLSIGAIGGIPTLDDMTGAAVSATKRYVAGPSVAIGLPLGFGLEADVLYRREGYQIDGGNFAGTTFADERANSWEFPLLGSYRLPLSRLKPFVEAGYAPRVIHGTVTYTGICYYCQGLSYQPIISHGSYTTSWPNSSGIVVGGGVSFRAGPLQLAPTVRYTHWDKAPVTGNFGDGPSWASSQDQFDVLLRIGLKLH